MSDRPLPRVTEILRAVGLGPDLSRIPAVALEIGQERGRAIHALIEAEVYGYLDPATVDPAHAPYLDAFRKFVAESRFEFIAAEVRVEDLTWRYCGHLDLIGWINGQRIIIDVKTGVADGADVQLAAYVQGWNAGHLADIVAAAAVLKVRDDGTYRLSEVDLSATAPIWHAALTVYHHQQRTRQETTA